MASITLSIVDVDGDSSNPVTVSPAPPWTVNYTVGGVGGVGNIVSLAYQIDDGPVNSIAIPSVTGSNSFQLSSPDLPASGQYLLSLFGWDDTNNSVADNRQITLNNAITTELSVQGACNP